MVSVSLCDMADMVRIRSVTSVKAHKDIPEKDPAEHTCRRGFFIYIVGGKTLANFLSTGATC
jgi:hypothetical protein